MTLPRDEILWEVSLRLGGRPVRWLTAIAEYDGRERTLEVFHADASQQRPPSGGRGGVTTGLLRDLRPLQADLVAAAGGPFVVVFHTSVESSRLYSDYLESWRRRRDVRLAALLAEWSDEAAGDPPLGPQDVERLRFGQAA